MIIRCIKCKSEFEQKYHERKCGCVSKANTKNGIYAQRHKIFWDYMGGMSRYFQSPIYQFIKEFITTESFNHHQTFFDEANEYGCICYLSINQDEAPHDAKICQCECHDYKK